MEEIIKSFKEIDLNSNLTFTPYQMGGLEEYP
jgi:hypothetical protein